MGKSFVVVGTRPEAIKLAPVIIALRDAGMELTVCLTGQHPTLAAQALDWFSLAGSDPAAARVRPRRPARPTDYRPRRGARRHAPGPRHRPGRYQQRAGRRARGASPASAGRARRGGAAHRRPRRALAGRGASQADCRPCRPAFRADGDRRAALRGENVPAGRVHLTGNTGLDALRLLRPGKPPIEADGRQLILVTCHRRESVGPGHGEIAAALRAIARRPDARVVLTLHPNPAVRAALGELPGVERLEPLPYPAFVRLLAAAYLVLTDSGGVQEEAPALGVPVLVLRDTTERPEGIAAGTARLVGTKARRIVAETCRLLDDPAAHSRMARAHSPFCDGRAAARIAAVLTGQPRPSSSVAKARTSAPISSRSIASARLACTKPALSPQS